MVWKKTEIERKREIDCITGLQARAPGILLQYIYVGVAFLASV